MTTPTSDAMAARRAAIEEELRQRLASDQAATTQSALADVALVCATCRGVSSADAHFCTNCGTQFNAIVVAKPAGASVRGSRT
jgi:hypothetical protein